MHFEASEQLIRSWAEEGEFGELPKKVDLGLITIGDRGGDVEELQLHLNIALGLDIDVDGIFGKETRAAVIEFQRQNGLKVDGIVGRRTQSALKKAIA